MKKLAFIYLLGIIGFASFAKGKPDKPTITLSRLSENIYIHTSYKLFGEVKFPSNGLVINTNDGVLLIDTPWDIEQTKQLMKWVKRKFKKKIAHVIITHAHDDRLTGMEEIGNKKVKFYAIEQTRELAKKHSTIPFDQTLKPAGTLDIGNITLEVFYPGPAHSPDNILIWFPEQQWLYGGCAVKDRTASSLGNVLDADLENWLKVVEALIEKYANAKLVIPGHGPWSEGISSLENTKRLLLQAQK